MKLHLHHPTSYSVKLHENQSIPYQVLLSSLFPTVPRVGLQFVIVVFPDHTRLLFCGSVWTNTLKCEQSTVYLKLLLSNFDAHYPTFARYIITISFMKCHPLVTRLWL